MSPTELFDAVVRGNEAAVRDALRGGAALQAGIRRLETMDDGFAGVWISYPAHVARGIALDNEDFRQSGSDKHFPQCLLSSWWYIDCTDMRDGGRQYGLGKSACLPTS